MTAEGERPAPRFRVWDWQTRLFHWALVVLFCIQWWSAKTDRLELHVAAGLTMIGLLLFRLVWGFIGGSTARFSRFVKGPRAIAAYLKGRAAPAIGHNPLGALSVLAMLLLLSVQAGLGLFSSDEDSVDGGPLSHWVSLETSERLLENHETLFNILLGLIGLHIAVILIYWLRGRNLVSPIIGGSAEPLAGAEPLKEAPAWRFLLAVSVAAALPLWLAFRA